jgi:hypothetical protein
MNYLIIGSTAIKHYFPDFSREPKDLDVVSSEKIESNVRVEYLDNPVITNYQATGYLKPNLLLTLKVSHLFWDINWEKHLYDIQFLFKKDCKLNLKLLEELTSFWNVRLPKIRRSRLNQSKEEFFTNAINDSTDEHDNRHKLLNSNPAYLQILKDNSEVEVDESKFLVLDFNEKVRVVFEETAVMAWERYSNFQEI